MKSKLFFVLSVFFLPLNALKIDRVILATDTNPTYIEFWPIVAKAWQEIIGIRPTLALIAHKDVYIDESLGDVIRFEPLEGIPTSLQAQTIRLLLPAYFPDDVCIISDIDMIPLSKEYFVNSVAHVPDDAFVIYRDKAYKPHENRFPMCYMAAKGETFKEVFKINSIHDLSSIIRQWQSFGWGWNTDEFVLYRFLRNWPLYEKKCIRLGHGVEKRIDRSNWNYDSRLLAKGGYIDAHCLRPYSAYKNEIDTIIRRLTIKSN